VSPEIVRAGIVATGTELLTGKVTDRNGPWLAERLGELGVEVAHLLITGDRPEDLGESLRFLAGANVDLIVTSGGLGPTADDVTAEVVGRFADRPLELDGEMEARIAEIIAGFARRMRFDPDALREANKKQAMVPRGAIALNPAGTAPGLVVPVDDGPTVVVLPGPPRELQAMWPAALETHPVRAILGRAPQLVTTSMRLFGLPESEIAQTLRDVEAGGLDLSPLEITTCLRRAELEIDVRHGPDARDTAAALTDAITARHGPYVTAVDGSSTDEQLAKLLEGHRLGLAESCTGGLLAGRLTDRPGSSAYLAGSAVTYSNEAKTELLGVPAALIAEHGAVSPQAAEAMALGALDRFDADVAAAITGVAGPGGGTEEKPVGYVCFHIRSSDGRSLARDVVLPGNRADIRDRSVVVAMHMLRRLLRGEELPV
jgi:competence/damage-inducible protein CinA-like protein